MANKYIIWGSSGHAKVLASLIKQRGGEVSALFDNQPDSVAAVKGVPLYIGEEGFKQWAASVADTSEFSGLVAIGGGRGEDRINIQKLFSQHKIKLNSIVHPDAFVCATAKIGAGTQVLAHALVAADAVVGDACIINHKSSVDHECIIGNGVHLAPSVTLCGCVELADNVFVATGSTILPRIKIGKGSVIGAGSLVTKDIPAGVVAYGSPAQIIRKL